MIGKRKCHAPTRGSNPVTGARQRGCANAKNCCYRELGLAMTKLMFTAVLLTSQKRLIVAHFPKHECAFGDWSQDGAETRLNKWKTIPAASRTLPSARKATN